MRIFRRRGQGFIFLGIILLTGSLVGRIGFKDFIESYTVVDLEFYLKILTVISFICIIYGIIRVLYGIIKSKARSAVNKAIDSAMKSTMNTTLNQETKYVTGKKEPTNYTNSTSGKSAKENSVKNCPYCNSPVTANKENCPQCGAPLN